MSDAEKKVLQAVRELAPMLSARAPEIEAARRLPADVLDQLKAAGCFRMFVPKSHGGDEVDLRTGLDVLSTLARADGATGWTVMIGSETPHLFSLLSRERFDALYAAGPDVIIAGGFAPQGEAHVAPGGYRVTGRWAFGSGCQHADYLFGNAVVMEGGKPRPGAQEGMPELRAMMFRPKDARIIDTWSVLGLRGTGSHDIAVEDLLVPVEDTLDIFGGEPSVKSPNFVGMLLHFLLHMGAVALGIAEGAVDELLVLAGTGKQRLYARKAMADSPLFQHRLGRARTTLHAARSSLYTLGDRVWAACLDAPASVPAILPETSATLAWITETTADMVTSCYRAGGNAALRDGPLQRRFRDIHALAQHAAAAEGWFGPSGAALLGQETGLSH